MRNKSNNLFKKYHLYKIESILKGQKNLKDLKNTKRKSKNLDKDCIILQVMTEEILFLAATGIHTVTDIYLLELRIQILENKKIKRFQNFNQI